MEMVAAVVVGAQAIWCTRIAHHAIEIEHCVEVAFAANPLVDSLSVGFAQWTWMIVVGANVGCDRGANDVESVSVSADDDLLVGRDDSMDALGMRRHSYFPFAGDSS